MKMFLDVLLLIVPCFTFFYVIFVSVKTDTYFLYLLAAYCFVVPFHVLGGFNYLLDVYLIVLIATGLLWGHYLSKVKKRKKAYLELVQYVWHNRSLEMGAKWEAKVDINR